MKRLLASLLTIASYTAFAATNPDWSFEFEEITLGEQKQAHWTIQSKHPEKDVTVYMRFIVLPEEEGLPNEWQFEYLFGPEAHHPKDMLWLTTSTNYKSDFSDRRVTSGRSVLTKGLTSAYVDRFHRQWKEGAELGDSPRELTIAYKTPDTHYPDKKWPWEQGVRATFSMVNWDKAYRQLFNDVVAKGGGRLLLTGDVLMHWPISDLPANTIKPPDEKLEELAKFLYMDMNEVYQMSLYDLKTELMIEGYYEQDQTPAVQEAPKPKPTTMSTQTVKLLRNFRWPRELCQRPTMPSINASSSRLDRFRSQRRDWKSCLVEAIDNDSEALDKLFLKLGGSTNPRSLSNDCNCHEQMLQLVDEEKKRAESYIAQTERLDDGVKAWNSKARSQHQQDQFWGGVNDALDNMNSDMQRLEQQRQQQWNSQIYTSPGYQ